ncbi:MAG: protease modulator HflC [Defluviitaleaceae bacterium]|nr:protease modulator HflC [Defluviitaleaceae bacterium]MCL2837275.1 protease modulator HflC [Defluviitaleaceae bacterium]
MEAKPAKKKMPTGKLALIGVIILLAVIVLSNSLVYVFENRYVAIKRFDRVMHIYDEPGLRFKIPFLDVAEDIPKNVMIYDLPPSDVLTMDKKTMTVSSYTVWKIVEPLRFLQNAHNIGNAQVRLDALTYNAIKNLISEMDQEDVIKARGAELGGIITANVRREMRDNFGVEIVDTQIKQFDLPQENKEAVFTRMISERDRIAATYHAEGREEAEKIRNSANMEEIILVSEARATAEQLRGEGEREYMRILSEAYNTPERAEFYEFVRSMDALKLSLRGETTIIMPMDTPLMRWLNNR